MSSTRAPVSFFLSPSSMFALSARMSMRPEPSDVAVVRFDKDDDEDDDEDDDVPVSFLFSVSADSENNTLFSLR